MTRNVLLIDSKAPSRRLLKQLAAEGFDYHRARGPLKLRTVLRSEPIDLILWRDRALTPELAEDLYRECQPYPSIPIIHLYGGEYTTCLPPGMNPVDSLPDTTRPAQIIQLITSTVETATQDFSTNTRRHSELDFRHVLSRLHVISRNDAAPSNVHNAAEDFRPTSVALNPTEREQLTRQDVESGFTPSRYAETLGFGRWAKRLRAALQRICF